MQHVLYIVFLRKRVLRTDKTLCTSFFEKKVRKKAIQEAHPPERPPEKVQKKVRKKAIREESRNPLKSSRRRLSAASALPKQRRKCSSNLKVFLIVRSFFACGDGEKARKFAFLEKDKQCRGRVSLHLLTRSARLASQTSKSRPARLSSTIYKTSRPRRDGERKIHKKERKTAPLMKI